MHAWLHRIGCDNETAELIELETGYLPPQHCAEQVLKAEMAYKPGFARDFLHVAQRTCASLQSRYLHAWGVQLMDCVESQASLHAANTAMFELLENPLTGKKQSTKSESSSTAAR